MEPLDLVLSAIIVLTGIASRRPFLEFPMDDDFSIYTYRARFAQRGFRWKDDLQLIGSPFWKMPLLDRIYGRPEGGVRRLRHLQTAFHVAASLILFCTVYTLVHNPWAAFAAGMLYAFYGTSPDLTAGSFNFEQFYIPFIFLGIMVLASGPESVWVGGLAFGLATLAKVTSGLYIPVMMLAVGVQYGWTALVVFTASAAAPVLVSTLFEWKLGYCDARSRRQQATRLASTLRLVNTKAMYFNYAREIQKIAGQTLPLWVAGLPGLMLSVQGPHKVWMGAFIITTLAMIVLQRGFSRYHYLPWLALLAVGTGFAANAAQEMSHILITLLYGGFALMLLFHFKHLSPFYFRPTAPDTLRCFEKYDQYLYLPQLGRVLKRLIRMRGETDERMFVWGTFTQLYHLTGLPASDNYLHYSIGPWDSPDLEGFFDATIGGLVRHRPVYLVKTYCDLDVDLLEQITGLRYKLIKSAYARYPVYRLTAISSVPQNPLTLPWQEKMNWMEALTDGDVHRPGVDRADFTPERLPIALKECRKLLRMNPQDIEGLIYMSELKRNCKEFEPAAGLLETVMNLQPFRPGVRLLLALVRTKQEQWEEAERLIDEESRCFSYNPEMSYLRGLIHRHHNQHRETVMELEGVRTLSPERVDCWEYVIEALIALEDREHLDRLYGETSAIKLLADRDWVRTRLATAVAQLNRGKRPEPATLNHYLSLDPGNIVLLYAHGSALERAGQIEEAQSVFNQITTLPHPYTHIRANAWFRLARLAPENGKKDLLLRCLDLDPVHGGARNLMESLNLIPSDTAV